MCLCCVYLGYCHSCMCMFLALQRPQVSLHLEISVCCSRASMRHLTCRHQDMPGQPLVDSKRSSRQLTSAKVSEGEQSNSTWSFPALQRWAGYKCAGTWTNSQDTSKQGAPGTFLLSGVATTNFSMAQEASNAGIKSNDISTVCTLIHL